MDHLIVSVSNGEIDVQLRVEGWCRRRRLWEGNDHLRSLAALHYAEGSSLCYITTMNELMGEIPRTQRLECTSSRLSGTDLSRCERTLDVRSGLPDVEA